MEKLEDITVSNEVLAEWLGGLTTRRINQLAKDGVVSRIKRNEFALKESVIGYIRFVLEGLTDEEGQELAKHELRLKAAKADAEETKVARMRGELAPVRDAQVLFQEAATVTRMRLRALVAPVIPLINAAETDAEKKVILQKQIDDALTEISEAKVEITAKKQDES